MNFVSLKVQGFRALSEPTLITFDGGSGIVHLHGDNGAGKSSIFEAIQWVLFGKTSRGLKGEAIATWNGKHGLEVELAFSLRDIDYLLKRTWKPITLGIANGNKRGGYVTIDQQSLEELLGFNAEAFLYSTHFAQFIPAFMDLSSSQQLAMFGALMEFDYWEDKSKEASAKVKETETKAEKAKAQADTEKGIFTALSEQLEEAELEECFFWREKYMEGNKLTADLLLLEAPEVASKSDVNKAAERARETAKLTARIEGQIKIAQDRIGELEIREKALLKDGRCTICLRPINKKYIVEEYKGHVMDAEHVRDLLMVDLNSAKEAEHKADRRWQSRQARALAYQEYVGKKERLEERLAQLAGKEFSIDLIKLNEKWENSWERYCLANAEVVKHQESAVRYGHWVGGFKDVRLFLVEEALAQLNIEVNATLQALGLEDWRMEFDVERETKKGDLRRGFTVVVHSPSNSAPVAWESWSGGETQRLCLAAAIGMSNLIHNRLGVSPNIELWDEPTKHLTAEGVNDLLSVLAQRAREQGRQIWLADHRALDHGDFIKTIHVEQGEVK